MSWTENWLLLAQLIEFLQNLLPVSTRQLVLCQGDNLFYFQSVTSTSSAFYHRHVLVHCLYLPSSGKTSVVYLLQHLTHCKLESCNQVSQIMHHAPSLVIAKAPNTLHPRRPLVLDRQSAITSDVAPIRTITHWRHPPLWSRCPGDSETIGVDWGTTSFIQSHPGVRHIRLTKMAYSAV